MLFSADQFVPTDIYSAHPLSFVTQGEAWNAHVIRLALHTAYWHDKFGTPRSHGCLNLAPWDARWLYFWSDPWVPPGWSMTAGIVEAPGSIVRVRSAKAPAPPVRGYAIRVNEARAQPTP